MNWPYDTQLLTAASQTPADIDDVVEMLRAIDTVCAEGDGLKWFNHLYLKVTLAVEQRCALGGFRDPGWLADLDVRFAELYFAALRTYLRGERAPACWRALLDRRASSGIARVQFAVAGINAHINHDLPLAVGQSCSAAGCAPVHGSAQYLDYTSVNTTLSSVVDETKRELMIDLPLPVVSHLEDALAAFSVTAAREAAWTNAEALGVLGSIPPLRDRALNTLDGITSLAGQALLTRVPALLASAASEG